MYRELAAARPGTLTTAGVCLASVLFAIDDIHAMTLGWLANRNLLITATFVLLAFRLHIRWQIERNHWLGAAAALLFVIALLTGESAVAFGAFVFAWAVTLHPGTWRQRALSILPGLLIGVVWLACYRRFGFGAVASGQYINPVSEPFAFLLAAAHRLPQFLAALAGTSITELTSLAHAAKKIQLWWWAVGTIGLLSVTVVPLARRDRSLQFWGLATFLSLLPQCAATPVDRVLLLTTVASHGFIARLLELTWPLLKKRLASTASATTDLELQRVAGRRSSILLAWTLGTLQLTMPAVVLPLRLGGLCVLAERHVTAATSPAFDQPLAGRTVVLINPPNVFYSATLPLIREQRGLDNPVHVRALLTGLVSMRLERPDDRTLIVRPQADFLHRAFADVYRRDPFTVGWQRQLTGLQIEVREVDSTGNPQAIAFQFDVPLESASLLWLEWRDGRYVPASWPQIGETREVDAQVTADWFGIDAILESVGVRP
ncbi:hypothetical protein GC176_22045 [bacterium]|nr:hypothetical protein [bacterium]